MGKGSGGGQNTVTNNSAPPPEVMAQYRSVIDSANNVAGRPLQQYSGPMVADWTGDQNQAFDSIRNAQGLSSPYLGQAQNMINRSQDNIWNGVQQWSPDAIQQYMNPYQSNVIDATMANINETNAQQNQQVVGDAISKGAWGGDRAGIAQAELARQQGLASNQTLAGLNAQNYGQATQQFNQQQAAQLGANTTNNWLASQGAFAESSLGNQAQQNALQGAAAQLAVGNQEQQQNQSLINVPYEQFMQQQAYPYQNLSWLSSLSTGLGGGMGGTSTSTQPGASTASQIGGTLLGAGSLLGATGAFGSSGWLTPLLFANRGGAIPTKELARGGSAPRGFRPEYDSGGGISPDDYSYIPEMDRITYRESTIPSPPQLTDKSKKDDSGGMDMKMLMQLAMMASGAPSMANGGEVLPINLSYIPTGINLPRGVSIPGAPKLLPKDNKQDSSQALGLINALGKNNKTPPESIDSIAHTGFSVANAGAAGLGDMTKGFQNPNGTTNLSSPVNMDGDSVAIGSPDTASLLTRLFGGGNFSTGGFADGGMTDDDINNKILELFGPNGENQLAQNDNDTQPVGLSPPIAMAAQDAPRGLARPDYAPMPKYTGIDGIDPVNKVNPWMALAAAGFGMAAGKSPSALTNVGAGAMEGIKNFQDQKQQAANEIEKQATLKQQGERLFDQANEWRSQLFDKSQHESATESQAQKQLEEVSRHNASVEAHARAQLEQGKYVMSPYGQVMNTKTGEVTGTPMGSTPPPLGTDGKPMAGHDFGDYLKQNDPDRAMRAQMLIDGDKKMPTLTSRTDPAWKQAIMDARMIDPTVSEERFGNKQKFQQDNKGQMDTFNTIPSHLKVLEDAARAIDNGDVQALNSIKNTFKTQIGSDLPTNLNTAKNMVSAEIVKAITGAGGVTDRKDAQAQFDQAASNGQLMGAIDMTKHLIGERINSAAYRYKNTVGGDYYQYIRPEVRSYLGVGQQDSPPASGAAPAAPATVPVAKDRIAGKTTATVKGKPVVWNGTGWDPVGWQP